MQFQPFVLEGRMTCPKAGGPELRFRVATWGSKSLDSPTHTPDPVRVVCLVISSWRSLRGMDQPSSPTAG